MEGKEERREDEEEGSLGSTCLALTCPSTGGDRGTANSVGSCSRQAAASLSSAQRSASFASERGPSAKIGARNKTTNSWGTRRVLVPPLPRPGYAITSVPLRTALAGLSQRKFNPRYARARCQRGTLFLARIPPNRAASYHSHHAVNN